jgi:hypothetical protein
VKLPFSVYDFFGYLASGFVLLVAADFAFDGGWLLREKFPPVLALFLVTLAYVTGHIVANISSFVLERKFLRGVLRSPEETMFGHRRSSRWASIFPGFYDPLPNETQERVLERAKRVAGIERPGRGLFFHCHPIVKREEATLVRLNTFLQLYGFCRNVCMSAFLAVPLLGIGVARDAIARHVVATDKLLWIGVAIVAAVGMLYRYLKFFREYTAEVFRTYAETPMEEGSTR